MLQFPLLKSKGYLFVRFVERNKELSCQMQYIVTGSHLPHGHVKKRYSFYDTGGREASFVALYLNSI